MSHPHHRHTANATLDMNQVKCRDLPLAIIGLLRQSPEVCRMRYVARIAIISYGGRLTYHLRIL